LYNSRPRYTRYTGYPSTLTVPENYSGNAFGDNFESEKSIADDDDEKVFAEECAASESLECATGEEISSETYGSDEENENNNVGKDKEEAESEECSAKPKKRGILPELNFGFNLGKIFGGGIGFEELLIIGLIFLIAQSEGNEDIIVLLVLLFFIG